MARAHTLSHELSAFIPFSLWSIHGGEGQTFKFLFTHLKFLYTHVGGGSNPLTFDLHVGGEFKPRS